MHGLFSARHYSDYVDQMLVWLTSQKKSLDPGQRGTAFYFLGIAAFACHDYQSATFFFDAAASEDFKVADTENQPAHLFMCLDPSNPNHAGRELVLRIVGKLNQAIDDYNRRTDAISISDSIVRANFFAAPDEASAQDSQDSDNYVYFVYSGVGLPIADD